MTYIKRKLSTYYQQLLITFFFLSLFDIYRKKKSFIYTVIHIISQQLLVYTHAF